MIPATLQMTLSIAVICYFVIILYYLKNRMLELKYTLTWLAAGAIMGIMILFPAVLIEVGGLLGVESNMNTLYILCFAFLIMICMSLTAICSRQSQRIRTLIQEMSMLEKRIRELENKSEEDKS